MTLNFEEIAASWAEMLRAGGRQRVSALLQIYATGALVASAYLLAPKGTFRR